MKTVTYSHQALKTLKRIDRTMARRITDKVTEYAADPASQQNNVTRLQGREGYRLRVGDYRMIFDEDDCVVAVLTINPRGGAYRR